MCTVVHWKKSDDFELEVHALHKNVACASASLSTFYTKPRIEIFSVHTLEAFTSLNIWNRCHQISMSQFRDVLTSLASNESKFAFPAPGTMRPRLWYATVSFISFRQSNWVNRPWLSMACDPVFFSLLNLFHGKNWTPHKVDPTWSNNWVWSHIRWSNDQKQRVFQFVQQVL